MTPDQIAGLRQLSEKWARFGYGRFAAELDAALAVVVSQLEKEKEEIGTRMDEPTLTETPQPAPADEPSCAHGLALDMHCCDCRRSGFFPPGDCDCLEPTAMEALRRILAEPHGCRFCDSGKLRTPNHPEKGHDYDCGFAMAERVLAGASTRLDDPTRTEAPRHPYRRWRGTSCGTSRSKHQSVAGLGLKMWRELWNY